MIAASCLFFGFLLGWLTPRDAFPWMHQLSAWFMRNRNNDRLAIATFFFAVAMLALLLLFAE